MINILLESINTKHDEEKFRFIQNEAYSYGDLMDLIYFLENGIWRKYPIFVQCLRASLSATYTRQYVKMRKKEKQKEKAKDEKKCLKNYLGTSVIGKCIYRMLPQITTVASSGENSQRYALGIASQIDMKTVFQETLPNEWSFNESIEEFRKKINNKSLDLAWIQYFEWIFMLFSKFSDDVGNEMKLQVSINSAQPLKELERDPNLRGSTVDLTIKNKVDFDILGFVKNIFLDEEYFEMIDSAFANGIVNEICRRNAEKDSSKIEELKTELLEKIKEQSLRKQYSVWFEEYGGFAIPFYNIDMTYSIVNRIIETFQESGIQIIKEDEILEKIEKLYENLSNELKKEAEIYKECQNELIPDVSEAFNSCPFIQVFNSKCKNVNEREKLQKIFFNIAKANQSYYYYGFVRREGNDEIVALQDTGGNY